METNICIFSESVPLYIFELWGTHVRTILKDSPRKIVKSVHILACWKSPDGVLQNCTNVGTVLN